ncbi:hypothetical protein ABW20_dc0108029 [Dactylellina cionopaga]|nr:hypothetical protein ABW20_dc0108029 [Dactylellina cionopaga]
MSLLLRRRSGQSSHANNDSSSGTYGLARELPDDFDPGIIYGTRHPDWSFPRRPTAQPTSSILRPDNGIYGGSNAGNTILPPQNSNTSLEVSHPRKRQAFFTEHFDTPSAGSDRLGRAVSDDMANSTNPEPKDPNIPPVSEKDPTVGFKSTTSLQLPSDLPIDLTEPNDDFLQNVSDGLDHSDWVESGELEQKTTSHPRRYSDISLDPLRNSSRFSFEASSAADSTGNEELTLSEHAVMKSQYHPHRDSTSGSSDIGSFTSDDVHSITSEDLRDEDGDGFVPTYAEFPPNIAPPPGFENIVVDTLENSRQLQQLDIDKPLERPELLMASNAGSVSSSEIGTNGSTTEEEEEEDGKDSFRNAPACPPFVNPSGVGIRDHNTVELGVNRNGLPGNYGGNTSDSSPILLFHNVFQTGVQGVNEYDANSPSSFLGLHPLSNAKPYGSGSAEYDGDDGDEDDMIAEANREVLASDNDGWYGQEFDFYPTSSTNSTYLAGGFFGIDLPKPGFIRNPSLTPISERSESSLRNSLSIISPNSISNGGISAGPLSAALFTELASNEQTSCDETTLTQLQLLSGTNLQEDNFKQLPFVNPSSTTAPSETNPQDNSSFLANVSMPAIGTSRSPFYTPDDSSGHHNADISTSYVHDIDLGWVMEKRRGGELIQRELVRGAV